MRRTATLMGLSIPLISLMAFANTPGVTDTEVVFGNHSMQSGMLAHVGVYQRTMKEYFDMINEKGGVHGRKIKFIIGDNAYNLQKGLQVIKKQVESDKVFAVLGNAGNPHRAVYKYLREQNVPDLWIIDPTDIYSEEPHPMSFQFAPPYGFEADFFGKLIAQKYAGKTLGVLYSNDERGKVLLNGIKAAIGDKLKIVEEEYDLRLMDPSAKAQVLNMKKANVDVIYTMTAIPTTPAAMKFAAEQNFKPQWILSQINAQRALLDLAGPIAEGAISNMFVYADTDTDIPAVKAHLEFMKTRMPKDKATAFTLSGQAAAELTVETLKRAGKNLTRESLVKAAESIKDFKCSVCREAHSTDSKRRFITKLSPVIVKGGKWVAMDK